MASTQNYRNGRLVAQWTNAVQPGDPTPAGFTAWDDQGAVTSQRALTAAEVAQLAADDAGQTESSNATTLQTKAQQALTANTNFLAGNKPNTAAAQASQAYDQAVVLTKECSALIRLALGLLDSTAGT